MYVYETHQHFVDKVLCDGMLVLKKAQEYAKFKNVDLEKEPSEGYAWIKVNKDGKYEVYKLNPDTSD